MATGVVLFLLNEDDHDQDALSPLTHESQAAAAPLGSAKIINDINNSHKHIWVVFVISILAASIAVLLLYLFRKKLYALSRKPRNIIIGRLKDDHKITLRKFELEELEKATKNFSSDCLLGSGSFSNVYKGTFHLEGLTVAIKRPHADSYQSVEEFRNEVKLISKVKHRNLLGLVGFCEEISRDKSERILVYEYVPNGSLLDYIIRREGRSLTWRQRVNIAIGAAKGIAYLHNEMKPSIIHRDIKPSNILIGERFEAKVADFGLVRAGPIGDRSYVSSQIKGTPGYLDPAYCSSFHLTPFSDVYSFGIILLQLVCARPVLDPTKLFKPNSHIADWARPSIEKGKVEDILDADLLLNPCNLEMMQKMGQVGLNCVSQEPKKRPTMSQVCQELEEALNECDKVTHKNGSSQPSIDPHCSIEQDCSHSQSFVSLDGVRLQKFQVENDSLSFQSSNLRCLDHNNSITIHVDNNSHEL